MGVRRPKAELVLSAEEQAQLSSLAASRALPHALVARAQLGCGRRRARATTRSPHGCDGACPRSANGASVSSSSGWSVCTTNCAPGVPALTATNRWAGLINRVLHSRPKNATHWSVRSVAEEKRHLQEQRGPVFRAVRLATAPQQELQALHRSVLRGKGA